MLMIGNETRLTPLTREVFGEKGDKTLIGTLILFSYDGQTPVGWCLSVGGDRELYIHPPLFKIYPVSISEPSMHARIRLEGGELKLYRLSSGSSSVKSIRDHLIGTAPPAVLDASVTIETILLLVERTTGTACTNLHCVGTGGYLDWHRSVLVKYDRGLHAFCDHCVDQSPPLQDCVVLDGRRIPPQAPIQLWNLPR